MRSKKVAPVFFPNTVVEDVSIAPNTNDGWICTGCQFENKPERERCAECFGLRAKSIRGDGNDSEKSSTTNDASAAEVCQASRGPETHDTQAGATLRVWECFKCAYRNPYAKYKCVGCGLRAGGPILLVKDDGASEPPTDKMSSMAMKEGAHAPNEESIDIRIDSAGPFSLPMKGIRAPHVNDVLFGRNVAVVQHAGNDKFRALVSQQQLYYLHATTSEGQFISRSIVRAVRSQIPPGRFLQKDECSGLWYDVGDAAASSKANKSLWEIRRRTPGRKDGSLHSAPLSRTTATAETPRAEPVGSGLVAENTAACESAGTIEDGANDEITGSVTDDYQPVEWECHCCTLLNPTRKASCDACGTKRKRRRAS